MQSSAWSIAVAPDRQLGTGFNIALRLRGGYLVGGVLLAIAAVPMSVAGRFGQRRFGFGAKAGEGGASSLE